MKPQGCNPSLCATSRAHTLGQEQLSNCTGWMPTPRPGQLPVEGAIFLLTSPFIEQLTRPRGLPKYPQIVQDTVCCGLDCGLETVYEFCGNPHFHFLELRPFVRIILSWQLGKPPLLRGPVRTYVQRSVEPSPRAGFLLRARQLTFTFCQREGQNASTWKRLPACRNIRGVRAMRNYPIRHLRLAQEERRSPCGGREY